MALTIDLPAETERRLLDRAARVGIDPSQLVASFVQQCLSPSAINESGLGGGLPNPNLSTIEMLERWSAEDAAEPPRDPADAEREWEEFKAAMNAHSTRGHPIFP